MSKRIEVDPPADVRRRRSEPQPERTRNDRLAYWLGTILIVFGILTGAVAFTMVRSHTINPVVGLVNYFVPAPETVFGKQRIFVLLLGLDYDYTITDQPSSKDARTDKIEVYSIDFPAKVIKTIAVPRDMDVVVNGSENKINAAYHYGGAWNTDAVVGGLLGMAKNDRGHYFDKYIALRINASKDVINAIGGLDVPVTENLNYDDTWGHLHIHFKPGLQHMDGDQAVSYARFRHDACSDPCRIKRQQQISKLIIEKLKNDKFNDLTHIAALIDVIRKNVDTNLTADEMKSLGWAFRDLNTADIHQAQVPFVTDKELRCCGDVLVPDTAALAKIVADFVGPYIAATPPPSAEALASVKPSTVRIDVRNGSGIPGLGSKLAAVLRKDGYAVGSVGNADSFDFDVTQIRVPAGIPDVGERVRNDVRLPQAVLVPIPAVSTAAGTAGASPAATGSAAAYTNVTVTVGRDYVNVPAPSAAPSAAAKPNVRLVRIAAALVAAAVLLYGGYRLYRRSQPPLPAVVLHDAALGPLTAPPLGDRLRHALLGSGADGRIAGPKLIALTFDDGPYPVETPVLLRVLADARVPGTFFLIGRDAEQYPGLVRAIAAGGHEIANHTETHPDLTTLGDDAVAGELRDGAASLGRYTSDPSVTHAFRPPHGRYRRATLAVAQQAGYDTILWTDDPGDWRNVSSATLADHIARYATSPEILLLHNGRAETVALLPGMIRRYRAAGYTFVTVADLLRRLGPDPVNHAARTPLSLTTD